LLKDNVSYNSSRRNGDGDGDGGDGGGDDDDVYDVFFHTLTLYRS